jgi:hypothetical protein
MKDLLKTKWVPGRCRNVANMVSGKSVHIKDLQLSPESLRTASKNSSLQSLMDGNQHLMIHGETNPPQCSHLFWKGKKAFENALTAAQQDGRYEHECNFI